MEKEQILEMAIMQLSEKALSDRWDNLPDDENRLFSDMHRLSKQVKNIVKKLSTDVQQILDNYIVKTNLIADHECMYLYV